MGYEIKLTSQAVGQIEEAVQYISKVLLEPQTARNWADTMQREIENLNSMPQRFPLVEEEPWRTKGIRKMLVGNFLVYYFVDEGSKTVWVTAVIYRRRDQLTALLDMTSDDAER